MYTTKAYIQHENIRTLVVTDSGGTPHVYVGDEGFADAVFSSLQTKVNVDFPGSYVLVLTTGKGYINIPGATSVQFGDPASLSMAQYYGYTSSTVGGYALAPNVGAAFAFPSVGHLGRTTTTNIIPAVTSRLSPQRSFMDEAPMEEFQLVGSSEVMQHLFNGPCLSGRVHLTDLVGTTHDIIVVRQSVEAALGDDEYFSFMHISGRRV